ncbi:MAG TPA: FGGY family carbohydrate kinase [Vicinamibacterales bacterium]|nr:FGGY family carbohydrate kinase [Vicinamibacterales bacterium]
MPIYLGFDSSTQGLTAIAIAVDGRAREVVWQHVLPYDDTFPQYGTRHGVLPSTDPSVAVSSPRMWAEALDRMFEVAAATRPFDLAEIAAISGSAQQHGSVYLKASAADRLAVLDSARPLVPQIDGIWSRSTSPIWMDTSTGAECAAITQAVGGAAALARLTGSRAFERFTGPQIRKFAGTQPDAYARTDRVHLVSSFLASLLIGRHAPLDPGDASGMNLMDLEARRWSPVAVDATAPELLAKLPGIVPASAVVGELSPYWIKRYGLPPARVVAWTGDNPSSLIGTGLVREGHVAISLGTSDTIFGVMDDVHIDPSGSAHVFGAPTGGYMAITVFRNGSLARERVRDEYRLSWDEFSRALRGATPTPGHGLMLPWFEPEITPSVQEGGVRRVGLDADDARANVRAVIEAQMMAMSIHSRWMGMNIDTISATGGASANREILQVMADVFNAPVQQLVVGNSACLGAALRACQGAMASDGREITWDEVIEGFVTPRSESIRPVPERASIYRQLKERYEAFERATLEDPT